MELEKLPKDVIQYLALEMDVGELLSLCRTNKELNVKICKNRNIWCDRYFGHDSVELIRN